MVTLCLGAGVVTAEAVRQDGTAGGAQPHCADWNTEGVPVRALGDFFVHAQPADVSRCLAAGADVNAVNEFGFTPLHRAARFNENVAVVEALLEAGADVQAKAVTGDPLSAAAAANENPAVLEALIAAAGSDDDVKSSLLLSAAQYNNNPAVVEVLIAGGADVMARDRTEGMTPLHTAALSNDNPKVVQALLAAGAEVNARTKAGLTPLHYASHRRTVDVLIAAGARIWARDANGRTPLHFAASWPASDLPPLSERISALIAHGASVDARDEVGDTPLHRAAAGARDGTAIIALLDAGADTRIRNDAGQTAWDLVQDDGRLKGSDGYWRLNEARYEQAEWDEPEQ